MKIIKALFVSVLTIFSFSFAMLLIKPEEAVKEVFPDAKIEKKNILITRAKKAKISKITKKPLKSSIFTAYIARKNGKVIGYALLHSHRIRTKNEVALISFDKDCNVIDTEIIAFYEPPEYIPSDKWQKNFEGKNKDNLPVLRQNIPNITGATLSTQGLTTGVREAIAICEVVLKEQFK